MANVSDLTLIAGIMTLASIVLLLSSLEWIGLKIKGAKSTLPKGLRKSLEASGSRLGILAPSLPRIRIIPEPQPYAMVLKSLGTKGTILITQGLLASSSEEELRTVLQHCLLRLRGFGMTARTLRMLTLLGACKLLPRSWTGPDRSLSPLSAVGLWILYSFFSNLFSFKEAMANAQGETQGACLSRRTDVHPLIW